MVCRPNSVGRHVDPEHQVAGVYTGFPHLDADLHARPPCAALCRLPEPQQLRELFLHHRQHAANIDWYHVRVVRGGIDDFVRGVEERHLHPLSLL